MPRLFRSSPALAAALAALAGLAALLAGAASCGRSTPGGAPAAGGPGSEPAPHPERIRETYRPPRDGRITRVQLETYEKVLSSAVGAMRGRPAPVPGGLALGDADSSPDVAEARREKVDPEEYLWVRERVLEAEATVGTAKLNADAIGVLERTLAELRSRRGAAADDGSRKLLDEQVTIFSGEVERLRKESREPEAESVRDNVRLIEPRRLRLEALEDEFRRLSSPAPSPAQPKAPAPASAASPAAQPAAGPR